jgi:hypothetical protein
MANYSIGNLLSDFGEIESPSKSMITMEEIDEISRKYFEEFDIDSADGNLSRPFDEKMTKQSTQTKSNFMDYIKIPSIFSWSTISTKNNEPPKENMVVIKEIKKAVSDPLSIIMIAFASIFSYIYFANEFMCQVLGLFYPIYYLYTLLHKKSNNKSEKIKSVMKYFIIYGHLEFLSALLKIFGFYFYHLKILVIMCILYFVGYHQEWLALLYEKTIFYDKIASGLAQLGTNKVYTEYSNIKSNIIQTDAK